MAEVHKAAQETLRGAILRVGIDDYVSLADVQGLIDNGGLAQSTTAGQELVMGTVRSLLTDGLVEVGVIPSPSSPGFKTWPGTIDEVMARFAERFVDQYDNRHEWAYKIWLNLTAKGRRASDSGR